MATDDNGKQQVAIYPQMVLSSIYGNETLYNVIQEGINNSSVVVSTDVSNVIITVKAGSTFFFLREEKDPEAPNQTIKFIGKVSLTEDASSGLLTTSFVDFKSQFWEYDTIYVVADWSYDSTSKDNRFIDFTVQTLVSEADLSGVDNRVCIASIHNVKGAITDSGAVNGVDGGNINANNLFIGYELQPNRDTLLQLFNIRNQFMVTFEGDGSGVTVNSGISFTGSSFLSQTSASPVVPPADPIHDYTYDRASGASIEVTGYESSYFQVDFLRYKYVDNSPEYVWESFLIPNSTPIVEYSEKGLVDLLAVQRPFDIKDFGTTILVAVRQLADIIVVNKNLLRPRNCIVMNGSLLPRSPATSNFNRIKLPVYSASEVIH